MCMGILDERFPITSIIIHTFVPPHLHIMLYRVDTTTPKNAVKCRAAIAPAFTGRGKDNTVLPTAKEEDVLTQIL